MAQAVGKRGVRRIDYYQAEADRVQRLAETAEPGRGREQFELVAAEYRSLADFYAALPSVDAESRPH